MKLLSVDPGKATGWAEWEFPQIRLVRFGEEKPERKFYELLVSGHLTDIDQLVVENYLIRPKDMTKNWGHEWNRGPALQVIGALELWSLEWSIPLKRQEPFNLPVGCGYAGIPYEKKKHLPNMLSAIAHGAYWLVSNKHGTPQDVRNAAKS